MEWVVKGRADGIALISPAVHTSPASVDGVRLDRCWSSFHITYTSDF